MSIIVRKSLLTSLKIFVHYLRIFVHDKLMKKYRNFCRKMLIIFSGRNYRYMSNYTHEISIILSKGLIGDTCEEDQIRSSKVVYAIENVIEEIKSYFVIFLLFGLIGKMLEVSVCIVTLTILRTWTGGTHMNTSLGCGIVTILFYGVSVFAGFISIPCVLTLILLVIYMFICVLYAPLASVQRPKLGKERVKRIKVRAVCGVILVILMYVCMTRYRDYIGRVVLLQFMDVVVAILISRNGGNKNDEKC